MEKRVNANIGVGKGLSYGAYNERVIIERDEKSS
jgi:hypothetical protein